MKPATYVSHERSTPFKKMKKLKIIPYKQQYHQEYKMLSLEWLEKFNLYEDADKPMLDNPQKIVLDKGGFIFLAQYDRNIVGTITLKKLDAFNFELLKLGVNSNYQGLGIGKKLVTYCIDFCKKQLAEKIILETNLKLESAIDLYKKLGFKEVTLTDVNYELSDLKMELHLN